MPSNSGQVRFVMLLCDLWLSETYCILFHGLSVRPTELDDILRLPTDGSATLSMLDTTLRRFVSLCASYHGQFPVFILPSHADHDFVSRTVPSKSTSIRTRMSVALGFRAFRLSFREDV